MRDALVLADGWLKLANLSPEELGEVGKPQSNPKPAADAVVEAEQ
jgi:hypothetical protein